MEVKSVDMRGWTHGGGRLSECVKRKPKASHTFKSEALRIDMLFSSNLGDVRWGLSCKVAFYVIIVYDLLFQPRLKRCVLYYF